MKSKNLILLFLIAMAPTGVLWAQQAKMVAPKGKPATQATNALKAQEEQAKRVDGDTAYKANCARCHAAPAKFSERQTATIMRHMRVRANLTEGETAAILKYLTR